MSGYLSDTMTASCRRVKLATCVALDVAIHTLGGLTLPHFFGSARGLTCEGLRTELKHGEVGRFTI